ncbi:sensor histidine kinase [Glaciimonas sp. PCH181]|uniref:sensor histidine kinase n=1 Tax=Glaciimonas sp. PCH181 TaxID=2133943 RepID=UPI000D3803A5|nr:sensor histidine kinase [Glaciimonas sp. PCH181]PUA16619.1 sensor histidine kinase [Glaciimonas sp. PCH181]
MIVSLRFRLLLWLLIPLAIYIIVSAAFSYRSAQQTADLIQDRALLTSAQVIASDITWLDGIPQVSVDPAALELFSSPQQDHVYYQIITSKGRLMAGRPDLPDTIDFSQTTPKFITQQYEQQTIRIATEVRSLYDTGSRINIAIRVAQTMRGHDLMLADLWRPSLHRQIAMLILAIALVVIGLTIELRPILRLKDDLATRDPMSLSPIKAAQLQGELRPIVDAFNHYIQRLNTQVAAQRRFIADAAHQLRTPLTLIDSQIQFARKITDPTRRSEVLEAMQESSRSMADLTDKLLLLSQAEVANSHAVLHQSVDLVKVVTTVLEDIVNLAQRKNIDLGIERQTPEALVIGNEALFTAMIMNLVDNAIRYTPRNGKVTVSINVNAAPNTAINNTGLKVPFVEVIVADNGPGIPAEIRSRVFERFYRHAAPGQHGTGLGLAIVKEIVLAAQGAVTLGIGPQNIGLMVLVQLPLATSIKST